MPDGHAANDPSRPEDSVCVLRLGSFLVDEDLTGNHAAHGHSDAVSALHRSCKDLERARTQPRCYGTDWIRLADPSKPERMQKLGATPLRTTSPECSL